MTLSTDQVTAQQVILVAGMHRSGTSALTRVLSLLGADLPDNLMKPVADVNPSGFWESLDVVALNDDTLESLGSSWDDVVALSADTLASSRAKVATARIAALLKEQLGPHGLTVIKDPRICRILPLWCQAAQDIAAEPLIVIPLRHPVEVAFSLRRRDGFSLTKGLYLWLRHLLDAERLSRGRRRVFCDYTALLADWRTEVVRICRDLTLTWPICPDAVSAEIDAFLSPALRNHTPVSDIDAHPDIVELCQRLWAAVHAKDATLPMDELDAIATTIASREALFDVMKQNIQARLSRLTEENAFLTDMRAVAHRETVRGRSALLTSEDQVGGAVARLRPPAGLWRASKDQALVLQSGLFNAAWYVARHPDVLDGPLAPVDHFLASGASLGYDPHPLFSLSHYTGQHPDVAHSDVNPLLHYLKHGANEGRSPHLLFDGNLYRQAYGDLIGDALTPLSHYVLEGGLRGLRPHWLFDGEAYLAAHPECRAAGISPLEHYVRALPTADLQPHWAFDPVHYARQTPDATEQPMSLLEHFLLVGTSSGARPNQTFDPESYRANHPKMSAQENPLVHYVRGCDWDRVMTAMVRTKGPPDAG